MTKFIFIDSHKNLKSSKSWMNGELPNSDLNVEKWEISFFFLKQFKKRDKFMNQRKQIRAKLKNKSKSVVLMRLSMLNQEAWIEIRRKNWFWKR
jgi:hypothetical protein